MADEDIERRKVSKVELRTTDDGETVLEGYATVYDYRYDVNGGADAPGGFSEVIARGAASKSVKESDVRLLVDHTGVPLARSKSGTLALESDDIGLRVSASLDPQNPSAAALISALKRGDMDQMSFAFRVREQDWNSERTLRTISKLELFDVSAVTYPANPATVVKLRDGAPTEVEQEVEAPTGRSVGLARRQADALRLRA